MKFKVGDRVRDISRVNSRTGIERFGVCVSAGGSSVIYPYLIKWDDGKMDNFLYGAHELGRSNGIDRVLEEMI